MNDPLRELRLFVYFLLGLVLGGYASSSFAINTTYLQDPTTAGAPAYQYIAPSWYTTSHSGTFPDKASACLAAGANETSVQLVGSSWYCYTSSGVREESVNSSCPSGYNTFTSSPYSVSNPICKSSAVTCPIGATNVSGTCTCAAGTVFYDGQCKTPVCADHSPDGSPGYIPDTGDGFDEACVNGCMEHFGYAKSYCPTGRVMVNGVWQSVCQGQWVSDGVGSTSRCSVGPAGGSANGQQTAPAQAAPSAQQPSPSCPAGQSLFYVNNNPGCVTTATNQVTTPPPTKTTTNTTVVNADGSTTITSKTVDSGTGQTTTSSVTYPAGSTVPTTPSSSTSASDYGSTGGALGPGGTSATGATSGNNITFPTDYARTGEAQTAANSINTELEKFLQPADMPGDPTDPGDNMTDFGSTFDALKSFQLPQHQSQCPTATFTVFNRAYVMDAQCTLASQFQTQLQAAMIVVWTIIALYFVLRA